jgi:hypothetical protein
MEATADGRRTTLSKDGRGANALTRMGKRILMGRSRPADEALEDDLWMPPRKRPLRKAGLTLLMIALGVAPGLALMATDPLGNQFEEVPPETARPAEDETATPSMGDPLAETPMPVKPQEAPDVVAEPEGESTEPERESEPYPGEPVDRRGSRVDRPADEDGAGDIEDEGLEPNESEGIERHCLLLVCLGPSP